ncbi:hypothetical protein BKA64DRAFT_481499 [Cadophora sp. MPI-SDFR-AT-0126]|nr:hypothetical protein BKA64DRAFT_481499 [Leotiomycetes sp. MPI-SDFR-AT-0126]
MSALPQSLLLTQLPREIRNQIWTFCIGNQDIHLELSPSTQKLVLTKPLSNPRARALLLACKQINDESNPVLYSTSTFHISSPPSPSPTLTHLTNTLAPSALSSICSIHLKYTLPSFPVTDFYVVTSASSGHTPLCEIFDWWFLWDMLYPELGEDAVKGSLDGLRDVKLEIRVAPTQKEAWRKREEEILGIVKKVGDGANCKLVLVLPWARTCDSDSSGREEMKEENGTEIYKGWKIERVEDDGKNVFTPFGAWNMQRELERVWESRGPIGL